MFDASLRLEVMRLPDYGLVFIEFAKVPTWGHARVVLPALGGAFVASWHAARRHGGLGGLPMLTARAGAGWLLERTGGEIALARRQAGEFGIDGVGVGESAWWREVGAQLTRIPAVDGVVPLSAF